MYFNRMLVKLDEQTGGDFPISPLMGTYCVGIACCIFAFLGVIVIKFFGRRTIYIVGCFGMGFSHVVAGIALLKNQYLIGFSCIILYIVFFQLTIGNVTYIYTAEVAVDSAAGVALAVQFVNMTLISFTTEYMIAILQVHGTFLYFGTFCIIGGILSILFVKETKGLTDLERKNLYCPAKILPNRIEIEPTERNLETELTERNRIN